MAQRLFLTNDDGTETIDLFLGVLKVTNWSFNPQPTALSQKLTQLPFGTQASSVGYPQVVETLTLRATGCPEDIRAALRQLEEFLENAAAYMDDPTDGDPHWLIWSSEGELAKRALVVGGKHSPLHRPPEDWQQLDGPGLSLTLALTRAPMWERETTSTITDLYSSVGGVSGPAAIPGRVPGRIRYAEICNYDTGTSADPITDIWLGMRPEGRGLTALVPVWECESTATVGGHAFLGDNTADAVVAGCHNGSAAVTTFADNVNERRVRIPVNNLLVAPGAPYLNAGHFAGRYLVLCRCFTTLNGDTEYPAIQMRSGLLNGVMTTHDQIIVDHASAKYVELGEIQIPSPGIAATPYPADNIDYMCAMSTIELWAQTLDAAPSSTLTMDCLVIIPTDFFIKCEDATIGQDAGGIYEYCGLVMREPDERMFGVLEWDAVDPTVGDPDHVWIATMTTMHNQWYLPIGDAVVVLAAQRATQQVIADRVTVDLVYYPRWTNYRE